MHGPKQGAKDTDLPMSRSSCHMKTTLLPLAEKLVSVLGYVP